MHAIRAIVYRVLSSITGEDISQPPMPADDIFSDVTIEWI